MRGRYQRKEQMQKRPLPTAAIGSHWEQRVAAHWMAEKFAEDSQPGAADKESTH